MIKGIKVAIVRPWILGWWTDLLIVHLATEDGGFEDEEEGAGGTKHGAMCPLETKSEGIWHSLCQKSATTICHFTTKFEIKLVISNMTTEDGAILHTHH